VTTDGVNFAAVWQHADKIDVNKIESNDIAAILRTYGVEAARYDLSLFVCVYVAMLSLIFTCRCV
jgi:hypothetical protein